MYKKFLLIPLLARRNGAATLFIIFCLLTGLPGNARGQNNPAGSGDNAQSVQEILALLGQSMALSQEGKIDAALPIAETALAKALKELSPEHSIVAMCLYNLGFLNFQKGNYEKAEPLYQRALTIAEKNPLGIQPFYLATILESLGSLYRNKADYLKAEPLYQRALAIRERTQGTEDASYVATLNNQGLLYEEMGDYDRAERLLQRALAVREKLFGPENIFVGESLKNLSSLYKTKGDYDRALLLLERALAIFEKLFGSEHPVIAASLNNLAGLHQAKGDYVRAEPLYQKALAIQEKANGPDSPSVAITLDNLGRLYHEKGDYARAESLYKRALAIDEKALGPEAPDIATILNNLALLYQEKRNYQEAEPLLRRALAMREKALSPDHPEVATALDNLAVIHYEKGDFELAEPLTQRALEIRQKAFGPNHPDVARTLNNIAAIKEKKGETEKAEALYQRAVSILETRFGPQHPTLAVALENLALFYSAAEDASRATDYLTRANDIWEHNIALVLAIGSEEQKRLYMSTLTSSTDGTVSLHLDSARNDMRAAMLALTTILRRKGRALDAMADEIATLRRHLNPEGKALLEQLANARSELANLVLYGVGRTDEAAHKAAAAKLESEVERLEAAVSERSKEFRVQSEVVTIERVQKLIPTDAALVELISYHPYNLKAKTRDERHGAARYAAYLLRSSGDPSWVDLGEAAPIDDGVADLRRALKDPQNENAKQAGRALDERVMRPIRTILGNTFRLLISPDGTLNLIPFAALVDEKNQYLIESYAITYLTSGRDLLRMQVRLPSRQPPVVIANPLFDATPPNGQTIQVAQRVPARRSADLSRATFSPLPGTAGEAQALAAILPRAKVLTGVHATEGSLKQLSSPDILHVATHGFFLPDQPQASAAKTRGLGIGLARKSGVVRNENPLLRSGIALAGANARQSREAEDGVLTALEAAGLDLWGTKLVVLSACETGVGEIKTGDGVYGLRRALVLAGAESQVMSLWQVSDAATRDLMVTYYKRLESGEGRSEALRQVQLEMLRGTRPSEDGKNRSLRVEKKKTTSQSRSHPFYWASFIPIGDWRSLEGKEESTRASERRTPSDK
ncbi:MAG: tetratricopeptide repeat protein [Pyrinomonadaceae bacterium]